MITYRETANIENVNAHDSGPSKFKFFIQKVDHMF